MNLDAARARFPGFSFAVYAFDPGGPVTLEILTGDETFQFHAATEAEAWAAAFPEEPEPAEPAPPVNVFD